MTGGVHHERMIDANRVLANENQRLRDDLTRLKRLHSTVRHYAYWNGVGVGAGAMIIVNAVCLGLVVLWGTYHA